MSIISQMLSRLFGKTECRVLMLGFDSPGRTTALYKMKLGEVVTTIPTIGFNVESVDYKRTEITFWDVGGRDKIRALWRHYFQGTNALIFVMNSVEGHFNEMLEEYRDELEKLLSEDELKDAVIVLWANKQDLPGALPPSEIERRLDLNRVLHNRSWQLFGTIAVTGEGVWESMDWMIDALAAKGKVRASVAPKKHDGITDLASDVASSGELAAASHEEDRGKTKLDVPTSYHAKGNMERILYAWLKTEEDEEETLLKFADGSLGATLLRDHGVRLRVVWSLLKRHGRREAVRLFFDGAKRLLGDGFHETTMYFWVHMIHYASEATANPSGDFKGFLLLNPQLADSDLLFQYYSQDAVWHQPEAATELVMPNKKPLPSLLNSSQMLARNRSPEAHLTPQAPLSDPEFLGRFEAGTLPSWGHEQKMRAIWLLLKDHGRRSGGTGRIFEALKKAEGSAHNVTAAYFWIQMLTFCNARVGEIESFAAFFERRECRDLHDSALIGRHYSDSAVEKGASEFALPDKKQLPNLIK